MGRTSLSWGLRGVQALECGRGWHSPPAQGPAGWGPGCTSRLLPRLPPQGHTLCLCSQDGGNESGVRQQLREGAAIPVPTRAGRRDRLRGEEGWPGRTSPPSRAQTPPPTQASDRGPRVFYVQWHVGSVGAGKGTEHKHMLLRRPAAWHARPTATGLLGGTWGAPRVACVPPALPPGRARALPRPHGPQSPAVPRPAHRCAAHPIRADF